MRIWKSVCALALMVSLVPAALAASATPAGQSPAGTWTTIDDKTGHKRAVISINVSGGKLSGTIANIFPQPGDTGICNKCPGAFKGKPIKGMQFIWGVKDEGNGEWGGGKILDPKTGKVYKVKLTMKGNKLYVRGFMGVSVFGRTQVWVR